MSQRIVVTGIGVMSPVGNGKAGFWEGLLNGRSNVTAAPWPGAADMRCKHVCTVPQTQLARPKEIGVNGNGHLSRKVPESVRFAYEACAEALADSGITVTPDLRVGLALGTAVGGLESNFSTSSKTHELGMVHSPAQLLASLFEMTGPVSTISVACAAGSMSLIYAALQLKRKRTDVMLAGGFDVISEVPFAGFSSLHLLTPDAVRPFDRSRSGFLIGEGAGIVVLETLESAQKRNAAIYAEIRGFGVSADGYHVIHPQPEARGLIQSMSNALQMAGCSPDEVDYVNSHGTATRANDKSESQALNFLKPAKGRKVITSSLKAVLGHTMGAAGAIETIGCLLALKHQCIPPTWNFRDIDPECNVDCVPNEPRRTPIKTILKNSSGFGGTNCSLLLSGCN
jgi:3-oxoacyl-[acyl-carrier-protein] synthase II